MTLDLSGAEQCVQDLLCLSKDYYMHDPKLAAELSSKAHEICAEFNIKLPLLDDSKESALHEGTCRALPAVQDIRTSAYSEADDDLEIDDGQDQLSSILGRQKALLGERAIDSDQSTNTENRPIWKLFSSLSRSQPA